VFLSLLDLRRTPNAEMRRTIRDEHEAWLLTRIRDRDFTLRGLVAELAKRGLKANYWAVWVFVHEQGLTHKKA
jgi:putative transposase